MTVQNKKSTTYFVQDEWGACSILNTPFLILLKQPCVVMSLLDSGSFLWYSVMNQILEGLKRSWMVVGRSSCSNPILTRTNLEFWFLIIIQKKSFWPTDQPEPVGNSKPVIHRLAFWGRVAQLNPTFFLYERSRSVVVASWLAVKKSGLLWFI